MTADKRDLWVWWEIDDPLSISVGGVGYVPKLGEPHKVTGTLTVVSVKESLIGDREATVLLGDVKVTS